MILASHVIITAYGFWLPNDQRGSWSDFIRNWELLRFGPATTTRSKRSITLDSIDHERREDMQNALRYPPVKFSGQQALWIGRAFAQQVEKSGFAIHACAILREHTHFVISKHRYEVEQVTNLLKGAATKMLIRRGLHPMRDLVEVGAPLPSPWANGLWKVFLDSENDILRSIEYVNENPLREGKRAQRWSFLVPYCR